MEFYYGWFNFRVKERVRGETQCLRSSDRVRGQGQIWLSVRNDAVPKVSVEGRNQGQGSVPGVGVNILG